MLIVFFLILSLFFAGAMGLWAYGKGWALPRCILFAVGMTVVLFLALILCKVLFCKVAHAAVAAVPGIKDAFSEKVKALL